MQTLIYLFRYSVHKSFNTNQPTYEGSSIKLCSEKELTQFSLFIHDNDLNKVLTGTTVSTRPLAIGLHVVGVDPALSTSCPHAAFIVLVPANCNNEQEDWLAGSWCQPSPYLAIELSSRKSWVKRIFYTMYAVGENSPMNFSIVKLPRRTQRLKINPWL